MTLNNYISLLVLFAIICTDTYINGEIASEPPREQQVLSRTDYFKQPRTDDVNEKVNVQLYYETLCPTSRNFISTQFRQVVLKLNKYLNIRTYPYGNARTSEVNGKYKFKCQHGPAECYGNILHACALYIVRNQTEALLYNSCMMDYSQQGTGSDNHAACQCGKSMKIACESIKRCAKNEEGQKLLKYYGDESNKVNYQYVPYILVNNKESDGNNFMKDVCEAYTDPPPPCALFV